MYICFSGSCCYYICRYRIISITVVLNNMMYATSRGTSQAIYHHAMSESRLASETQRLLDGVDPSDSSTVSRCSRSLGIARRAPRSAKGTKSFGSRERTV